MDMAADAEFAEADGVGTSKDDGGADTGGGGGGGGGGGAIPRSPMARVRDPGVRG